MLILLTISPLGKITRCDSCMLQMSFPQSTEQVALEGNVARHTVPDCRGRTTDNKSKGWREWKGKKKQQTFCQLTLRKESHMFTLPVFRNGDTLTYSYWAPAMVFTSQELVFLLFALVNSSSLIGNEIKQSKTGQQCSQNQCEVLWNSVDGMDKVASIPWHTQAESRSRLCCALGHFPPTTGPGFPVSNLVHVTVKSHRVT